MSRPKAQAEANASNRPEARTAHGIARRCHAAEPGRLTRPTHHGSSCRPHADARANAAMASAPPQAEFANPATTSADCSSPQGQNTHANPDPAAGKGPEIRCQPGAAVLAVWGRKASARRRLPASVIQAGCLPAHAIHRPSTRAAACSIAQAGRSTGTVAARPPTAPTPAAARPPPAAYPPSVQGGRQAPRPAADFPEHTRRARPRRPGHTWRRNAECLRARGGRRSPPAQGP